MDTAEEIPQLVNQEKNPCVDGNSQQHSPASKVFDDDDLLVEILLRLSFATTLVRASLVCKRWLHHASDRKFLRRFRKLHPPRLLGFYLPYIDEQENPDAKHFFPVLPQPPELAPVIRCLESVCIGPHGKSWIMDCRNGTIFSRRLHLRPEGREYSCVVHRPLCPEKDTYILPPLPVQDRHHLFTSILSKEDEGGLSYLYLLAGFNKEGYNTDTRKYNVCVYILQDGGWRMHTFATSQVHRALHFLEPVLAGNKIYMMSNSDDEIIVLDLMTSILSSVELPQGVKYQLYRTILSPADDASSVYLIHVPVKQFQLCIWGGNWLLVDSICLHEMCVNLGILDHTFEDEHTEFPSIYNCKVVDNAAFVFLKMRGCALCLDVTGRTLREVFHSGLKIHPFVMIWPPTFPALKDGPARG